MDTSGSKILRSLEVLLTIESVGQTGHDEEDKEEIRAIGKDRCSPCAEL